MTQERPFTSVIIPVYNDRLRLRTCLEALHKQSYPSELYEIIVVDNGSNESLDTMMNEFKMVRLEYEDKKGSYAARNKGISKARGSYFAFTDSDCLPEPEWLETGVAKLLENPACGLIAGRINIIVSNPEKLTPVEIYERVIAFPQKRYVNEYHFGATANVFTRREVFEKVGLFNSDMRSGGDREWGNRVFNAGYRLIYAKDVRVSHPARKTFREIYRKATRVGRSIETSSIFGITKSYIRVLFVPPVELLSRGIHHKELTFPQKVRFVLVVFFVKYAIAWQKTKMLFGATPKR